MRKILLIILGSILIVVAGIFTFRALTVRNSFELNLESDCDVQFLVDGVGRSRSNTTFRNGLTRLASTTASANPTFYKVGSNDSVKAVTSSKYFLKKELVLRTTNDYGQIRVAINLDSDNSEELNNALRVMLVIDGRSYIFAPGKNPNLKYKGVAGSENGKATYNSENEEISRLERTYVIPEFEMLQEFKATIYIWYEAKDGSISNFKASGKHNTKLNIAFC